MCRICIAYSAFVKRAADFYNILAFSVEEPLEAWTFDIRSLREQLNVARVCEPACASAPLANIGLVFACPVPNGGFLL